MKQSGFKPNATLISIILLLVGLALVVLNIGDMFTEREEAFLGSGGGPDDANLFYLPLGVLLFAAGVIGIRKTSNSNNARRRW